MPKGPKGELMAETKEDVVKRRWLAIQEELNPGETDLSRTLENIAVVRAGWHRVRNEAGEWAYFPSGPVHPSGSKEARVAEDAWQARALEMHSAQEPVILAPKPRENALSRIVRAV